MKLLPGKANQRASLRIRYLSLATLAAVILIIGAITSSQQTVNANRENSKSLQLSNNATQLISHVRHDIWQSNSTLSSMLISPLPDHEEIIRATLNDANQDVEKLTSLVSGENQRFSKIATDIKNDSKNLSESIFKLIKLTKDPNWVYPMLPFINQILLESNIEFETAVTNALHETAELTTNEPNLSLYRELSQLRDLWRLQILEFRAVIIRFAGLNRLESISQEKNIDLIHSEITERLNRLQKYKGQGKLGLESEEALDIMQLRADKWYTDFQELKKIRSTKIWRADINYEETVIRPIENKFANDLDLLEHAIHSWHTSNMEALEIAANQTILKLWGLAIVSLIFIWLVYTMLSRGVLGPLAQISDAITDDINKLENLPIARTSSTEVRTLITAFNTMHRQIHHRQMALEHQALHDSLTGLPNRALLNDRLEQAIHMARRQHTNVVVMLLDLDRFKEINDSLGHPVGDLVLQVISSRLESCVRDSDTVARLGGDEFAIICPNINTSDTAAFIDKIIETTGHVITVNNHNLYTGASIGVSIYPDNARQTETLIRQADVAMYEAKQNSKGYVFFDTEMDKQNAINISLLANLRDELKNNTGQFVLHYQPQINLKSLEVKSAEALLRWNHPDNGLIPPSDIIHLTEQTNLIDNLTYWVIEQAARDCASWMKHGINMNVSVNLSARNLQNTELAKNISGILSGYHLDPSYLTLEITESAVMSDPIKARDTMRSLHDLGVTLDIDDFGTGFSSLAYLKMLPLDRIKIDKSFVINLLEDENDITIVKSTIDLGHNLNLTIIAEGVETEETYNHLRNTDCDLAQGIYIAPPMPINELESWYASYQPDIPALQY